MLSVLHYTVVAWLFFNASAYAQQMPRWKVEQAQQRYRHEPSVGELVKACIRHQNLSPSRTKDMVSRAKMSGWIPQLRLGIRRGIGRDLSEVQSIQTDRLNLSTGDDLWLEGSLTFRLEQLAYSDQEVAILRQERVQAEDREQLIETIIGLYYERRQLQLERDLFGQINLNQHLRIQQIAALLDSLSGGWFWRSAKNRSVPR